MTNILIGLTSAERAMFFFLLLLTSRTVSHIHTFLTSFLPLQMSRNNYSEEAKFCNFHGEFLA